jgi:hypothetical protein
VSVAVQEELKFLLGKKDGSVFLTCHCRKCGSIFTVKDPLKFAFANVQTHQYCLFLRCGRCSVFAVRICESCYRSILQVSERI